jgi:hypothetical protein
MRHRTINFRQLAFLAGCFFNGYLFDDNLWAYLLFGREKPTD